MAKSGQFALPCQIGIVSYMRDFIQVTANGSESRYQGRDKNEDEAAEDSHWH